MNFLVVLVCSGFICGAFSKGRVADHSATQGEVRLHHRLQRYYEALVRPIEYSNETTTVKVAVAPLKIANVIEEDSAVDLIVLMRQEWHDAVFMWDPEEYGGVDRIRVTNRKIWRPDIASQTHQAHSSTNHKDVPLLLSWDGSVSWQYTTKLRADCDRLHRSMNPLEQKQKCTLHLRSVIYSESEVSLDFLGGIQSLELSQYVKHKHWQLLPGETIRSTKQDFVFSSSENETVPSTDLYEVLSYEFSLERQGVSQRILSCFLPLVFISLLVPGVFLLPQQCKLNMAVGLLIALILLYQNFDIYLASNLQGRAPYLDHYYTAILSLSCLTCLVVTMTTSIGAGPVPLQEPPVWLKKFMSRILTCLSWMTCFRHLAVMSRKHATSDGLANGTLDDHLHGTATTSLTVTPSYSSLNSLDKGEDTMSLTSQARQKPHHNVHIKMEWQLIAVILDRCFYLLFLVLTTILLPIIMFFFECL